jgi:hypothetical protein
MKWKYEFIDITLILTLNDDIVVTLNDLIVILTSTILVNLVIMITLVHHVSSRQRTIVEYMLVSLYIRAHQNAQETLMTFLFTSATNLSFLNRFNGLYEYMIIQIIYKQLLLGMNMTQGLMPP